jgi:hypothetical protein
MSLPNRAASSRRIARISSVGVGITFGLPKLLGRANDRRLETIVAANRRDPDLKGRIRDMLEVPRHQVLYTVDRRRGDVKGVTRRRGMTRISRRDNNLYLL